MASGLETPCSMTSMIVYAGLLSSRKEEREKGPLIYASDSRIRMTRTHHRLGLVRQDTT